MALLYGLLRSFAATFRMLATKSHRRAKAKYEELDDSFKKLESECKSEEVAVGRPMDYVSQIRLLKAYEAREAARKLWVKTVNRLNKRTGFEKNVVAFSGRKLPYTFGLIDMAVVFKSIDVLTSGSFDLPRLVEGAMALFG